METKNRLTQFSVIFQFSIFNNFNQGLIFDFKILAERDTTTLPLIPLNPVDANLANKWTVTNTSPIVTLGITEKVSGGKGKKGKGKEEWQPVELAQYEMPFQLTMVLAEGSPAPKRYNTLSTLWGGIKAE